MNIKDVRMADDKTLWIKVGSEFENIGRVIVEDGNWCKVFYQDVEPEQEVGRWVKVGGFVTPGGDPVWECSACGKGRHVYGIEHGTYGADVSDEQWKACPNCGARMEGETE